MDRKDDPKNARVLVVDDEEGTRDSLEALLEDDYDVVCVDRGMKALACLKREEFNLVLLDLTMPEMSGIETLKRIRSQDKEIDVIIVSAIDRAEEAMAAIQTGAFDYITKPFDPETILARVGRALRQQHLEKEVHYLRSQIDQRTQETRIISQSKRMDEIFVTIDKVAQTSSSVLINGESGTGKELVAKAIHTKSQRAKNPFVPINCASIPAELIESELFGYEKGAFTGAHQRTQGKFEFANGGTLFLDEIASLKIEFQAQLLRVLQQQEITRVGGNRVIKIDVRIIAATNMGLSGMVDKGRFRKDLFFRLNVIPINLPPLRQRKEDISLLAHFFLGKLNRQLNKNITDISPAAMTILESYPWPGNIRELENLIERMVVLGTDNMIIDQDDLPYEVRFHKKAFENISTEMDDGSGLIHARHSFERAYILQALKKCGWNQSEAARALKIHRNTLLQKIKALNLKLDPQGDANDALNSEII